MSDTPENNAREERIQKLGWLLGNGNFLRLLTGSLFATSADRVYQAAAITAMMLAFLDASGPVSVTHLAGVLGQFLLYPFIGALVDRMDRRTLLLRICGLKFFLIGLFLPFLLVPQSPLFKETWWVLALLVFAFSAIKSPYGPARAAALPDLVPPDHINFGAGFIAASGLLATLAGAGGGMYFLTKEGCEPWMLIPISIVFYGLAWLSLRGLPVKPVVPETPDQAASKPKGWSAYFKECRDGMAYCCSTRGILPVIVFEAIFWIGGVLFFFLINWHVPRYLYLAERDKVSLVAFGLCMAGVGLLAGALLVGKWAKHLSPILTYPIAVVLAGFALGGILSSRGTPNTVHASVVFKKMYTDEKILSKLPPEERTTLKAEADAMVVTDEMIADDLRLNRLNEAQAKSNLWWLFILFGMAGGLLIGRIDADVLAISGPEMRGRVFAVKGFFFTGAMIIPLGFIAWVDHWHPGYSLELRGTLAQFLPLALYGSVLAVLPLAWLTDCGIYAEHWEPNSAGPVERLAYMIQWWLTYIFTKLYFRMTVIGAEKIPATGPVILSANHGSFMDPLWLGAASPRQVQYMMHSHYYRGIGHPWFRMMNTVPVDEAQQLRAIRTCAQALGHGICVGIFPEGTVTSNGKLSKPKLGAVFIAQKAGAPVLPVAIKGNMAAFPRKGWFPKPLKITVIICDPVIVPKDAKKEALGKLTDQIMATIAQKLDIEAPPSSLLPDDPPPVAVVKPA